MVSVLIIKVTLNQQKGAQTPVSDLSPVQSADSRESSDQPVIAGGRASLRSKVSATPVGELITCPAKKERPSRIRSQRSLRAG
jgi:hypothetical protein